MASVDVHAGAIGDCKRDVETERPLSPRAALGVWVLGASLGWGAIIWLASFVV